MVTSRGVSGPCSGIPVYHYDLFSSRALSRASNTLGIAVVYGYTWLSIHVSGDSSVNLSLFLRDRCDRPMIQLVTVRTLFSWFEFPEGYAWSMVGCYGLLVAIDPVHSTKSLPCRLTIKLPQSDGLITLVFVTLLGSLHDKSAQLLGPLACLQAYRAPRHSGPGRSNLGVFFKSRCAVFFSVITAVHPP